MIRKRFHMPALALSLIIGMLIGVSIIPVMFKFMPGDTARSLSIIKAIRSNDANINGCFLGNSVVMNGINTAVMSDSDISVWNYSTPGQTLLESSFVLCQTPESYRMAMVGLSVDTLCTNKVSISEQKATAYRMYGYQFPQTFRKLTDAIGEDDLTRTYRQNRLVSILKGRWIIRNGFDMYIRNALRRDLDLKRADTDMLYPSPYTSKVSSEALELLLQRYYQPRKEEIAVIAPENKVIIQYMADQMKKRNGRLILVVLPEHPVKRETTIASFYNSFDQQLKQLQENFGIEVINCIDLLSREEFIDHIHPSPEGAEHLTSVVTKYVQSLPPFNGTQTFDTYVSNRH